MRNTAQVKHRTKTFQICLDNRAEVKSSLEASFGSVV